MSKKMVTQYVIYNKDDMPVFVGNMVECAKFLDTTPKYIKCLIYRTKKNVIRRSKGTVYRLEEE